MRPLRLFRTVFAFVAYVRFSSRLCQLRQKVR